MSQMKVKRILKNQKDGTNRSLEGVVCLQTCSCGRGDSLLEEPRKGKGMMGKTDCGLRHGYTSPEEAALKKREPNSERIEIVAGGAMPERESKEAANGRSRVQQRKKVFLSLAHRGGGTTQDGKNSHRTKKRGKNQWERELGQTRRPYGRGKVGTKKYTTI